MLTAAMTRKHARHWRELTAAIRQEAERHLPPPAAPRGPGAWGYIRVSREEQVQSGLSLEHQAKVCRDIYEQRVPKEVPFMELLADEAASAFRKQLFQREKGRRLLTELQAGDYLIFLRMDRAVRNIGDLLRILKVFEEREVNVLVAGGRWDYSTADGRFMLHVMAAMTQWEPSPSPAMGLGPTRSSPTPTSEPRAWAGWTAETSSSAGKSRSSPCVTSTPTTSLGQRKSFRAHGRVWSEDPELPVEWFDGEFYPPEEVQKMRPQEMEK